MRQQVSREQEDLNYLGRHLSEGGWEHSVEIEHSQLADLEQIQLAQQELADEVVQRLMPSS